MQTYLQADRPMNVWTPLGKDVLLLAGFRGQEGISRLFHFELDLIAENGVDVPFESLLGQRMTIELHLPGLAGKSRHISGVCNRISQGGRDQNFTAYRAEMVPEFWFLTKRTQSRIFQHMSVPDILKKVLTGLEVDYQIQGTFHPRDYCVQYRESDFDFASRLMEEEGIFYFFKHDSRSHKMVLANTPDAHPEVVGGGTPLIYDEVVGGNRPENRVIGWRKTQELRSGKVTLWDHCFELPHKHLEASKTIQESAEVGQVAHKLKLGLAEKLEQYDYPGAYAQRFDGVDRAGGDRAADLEKIHQDNKRTAEIRMQQEAVPGLLIEGESTCGQLASGHRFALTRHFNADGVYVLTGVEHSGRLEGSYRSGGDATLAYENGFTCIPASVPYRPPQVVPRPTIHGTQTAVVVGPKGEEIFTDKYGRVKVQFHWDRQGRNDSDSSCWIRVAQLWAGRRWGASFWPRVGQEVVVAFEEGDPDRPIIIGSVYNADQMPPYLGKGPDSKHAEDNKVCGIKSNSTTGGSGFNEWRFDDTKGKEQVFIHAQRDMDVRVLRDSREQVMANRHLIVGPGAGQPGDQREMVTRDKSLIVKRHQHELIEGNMFLTVAGQPGGNQDTVIEKERKLLVGKDEHIHIGGNRADQVDKSLSLAVGGDRFEQVAGDDHYHVKGNCNEQVDGSQSLTISGDYDEKVGMKHAVDAGMEIHLKAGMKVVIESGLQLTLKGPGGFVDIGPAGVTIQGIMVLINSGGAAGAGSGASPTAPKDGKAPKDAKAAQPVAPDVADNALTGQKSN